MLMPLYLKYHANIIRQNEQSHCDFRVCKLLQKFDYPLRYKVRQFLYFRDLKVDCGV